MEPLLDEDEFDYYHGISTASFGDMLHDNERNEKFSLALEKAIRKMHFDGRKAHVLDIGTGTGLLAMLAVRHGADTVVACEMFEPVANCALKIIKENYFEDKIKLVKKHSTQLTVGSDGDLRQKANILVSEVFDTELIGEGAISTFNHAHQYLLEDNSIVIPSLGIIYGQLVESDSLLSWNGLTDWSDDGLRIITVSRDLQECRGAPSLFDLQLSQVSPDEFVALTDPTAIFRFNFMNGNRIASHEHTSIRCPSKRNGKAQAVFMWWDLIMDFEGEIILSCAPVWHHPSAPSTIPPGNPAMNIPWRDHWMQAVYFLKQEAELMNNTEVIVRAWHDEFSFWFSTCTSCQMQDCTCSCEEPPACTCGFHLLTSRTRLAALNDRVRRKQYLSLAKTLSSSYDKIIFMGDFSLLALVLAKIVKKEFYILTGDDSSIMIYKSFLSYDKNVYITKCAKSLAIEVEKKFIAGIDKIAVVAEPYFGSSLLPWDNVSLYSQNLENFFGATNHFLDRHQVSILPETISIKGCAVKFDDLWKISQPVNDCMGLKIKLFDQLITEAKTETLLSPEPQPLWEYPCIAVSPPTTVIEVNVQSGHIVKENSSLVPELPSSVANAIAFWVDYHFIDNIKMSTGPLSNVQVGQYVTWSRNERQGVHLYSTPIVGPLKCHVKINNSNSSFTFQL